MAGPMTVSKVMAIDDCQQLVKCSSDCRRARRKRRRAAYHDAMPNRRLPFPTFALAALLCLQSGVAATSAVQTPPTVIDPPPVDEAALISRLVSMTQPARGERAIIVFDPRYYPGITNGLRDELSRRGVDTYLLVEDSEEMIRSYINDDAVHDRREAEVIETLLPLFRRADIFYWMPARGYPDDLRWERLVERSRVRSVHFHWFLPYPGERTNERIVADTPGQVQRCLDVDVEAHARRQDMLAAALRGQTLRITTPGGTDIRVDVPRDQWFHQGDGDASKARAARARSIRDRQIELPVGMFNFLPDANLFEGTLVAPAIPRAGADVRDVRMTLRKGRVVELTAGNGADRVRETFREIGPDGDLIATVSLNTNPHNPRNGVGIEIGSNWENGGRNRAKGASRLTIRLTDATLTSGGRVLVEDGAIRWDRVENQEVTRPRRAP